MSLAGSKIVALSSVWTSSCCSIPRKVHKSFADKESKTSGSTSMDSYPARAAVDFRMVHLRHTCRTLFLVTEFRRRLRLESGCRMRIFLRASALSVCVLLMAAAPNAFAVNKDLIALQAQVQQMQDMMMSMQQANDERYATMHNLLQQTSESVAKVAAQVDSMQKAAQDQQSSQGNSLQQLSGQMQSMNDSLDELRARLDKLDKALGVAFSRSSRLSLGWPACSPSQPGNQGNAYGRYCRRQPMPVPLFVADQAQGAARTDQPASADPAGASGSAARSAVSVGGHRLQRRKI